MSVFFRLVLALVMPFALSACEAPGFSEHIWPSDDQVQQYRSLLVPVTADRSQGLIAPLANRSTYMFEGGEAQTFQYALPPVASVNETSYLLATGLVDEEESGSPDIRVRYSAIADPIPELTTANPDFTVNEDGTVNFTVTVIGQQKGLETERSAVKLVIGVLFVDSELAPVAGFVDDTLGSHAAGETWVYELKNVPVDPEIIRNDYRIFVFDAAALPADS